MMTTFVHKVRTSGCQHYGESRQEAILNFSPHIQIFFSSEWKSLENAYLTRCKRLSLQRKFIFWFWNYYLKQCKKSTIRLGVLFLSDCKRSSIFNGFFYELPTNYNLISLCCQPPVNLMFDSKICITQIYLGYNQVQCTYPCTSFQFLFHYYAYHIFLWYNTCIIILFTLLI